MPKIKNLGDMLVTPISGVSLKKFFGKGSDGAFDSNGPAYKTANLLPWNVANGGESSTISGFTASVSNAGAVVLTVSTVAANIKSGTYGMTAQNTSGSTADLTMTATPVPVTAGQNHTFQVWGKGAAVNWNVTISWYDASDILINSATATIAGSAAYKQVNVTGLAPANAVTARCTLTQTATVNNGVLCWDEAMLSQTAAVQTWVAGSGYVVLPVGSQDGPPVVKQYTTFNLRAGHYLTVDNRCRGLVIYTSLGDAIISGTIDISNKAAIADPATTDPLALNLTQPDGIYHLGQYVTGGAGRVLMLQGGRGGRGGAGGMGGGSTTSLGGGCGSGGAPGWFGGGRGGAGGGGGALATSPGGAGGAGGSIANPGLAGAAGALSRGQSAPGSFSGGAGTNGSGGSGACSSTSSGSVTSGAGGSSINGGGAGGGGGAASDTPSVTATAGGNGTAHGGALLLFISVGAVTIGPTGVILVNGGNGAKGGNGSVGASSNGVGGGGGGGGGGAGGGAVGALYKTTWTNNGTIQVNGGAGGAGGTGAVAGSVVAIAGETGENGQSGMVITMQIT